MCESEQIVPVAGTSAGIYQHPVVMTDQDVCPQGLYGGFSRSSVRGVHQTVELPAATHATLATEIFKTVLQLTSVASQLGVVASSKLCFLCLLLCHRLLRYITSCALLLAHC